MGLGDLEVSYRMKSAGGQTNKASFHDSYVPHEGKNLKQRESVASEAMRKRASANTANTPKWEETTETAQHLQSLSKLARI